MHEFMLGAGTFLSTYYGPYVFMNVLHNDTRTGPVCHVGFALGVTLLVGWCYFS